MHDETGQIASQEALRKLLRADQQYHFDEAMRKQGWMPFEGGEPVSLYNADGLVIGRFTICGVAKDKSVILTPISKAQFDELCAERLDRQQHNAAKGGRTR